MRKILTTMILLLFIFPIISAISLADSGPELQVGVFGTSLLTGFSKAGSFIYNGGDEDIYDVTFTFSVIGGYDESINKIMPGHRDILQPNTSYLLTTNSINGFGPVTLSIYASSSNAGSIEETIKGFQLGSFTITQPYVISWY